MPHSAVLEPIIHSPALPQLLDELNKYWEDEQNRRLEFYNWVTPDLKAEFIEGEIVVHSPVRSKHNVVLRNVLFELETFWRATKKGYLGVEKIMTRFTRNDYEPDICYFREEKSKEFNDEQTIFPAPDFVIEILSSSTAARDRGVKFADYEAHGVEEYWIIDSDMKTVEQYILEKETQKPHYVLQPQSDVLKSAVMEGLEMKVSNIFD